MTLMDGLTVLAILAAFGVLIISHIRKKNPRVLDWVTEWFREKTKMINKENKQEKMEQIYPKRSWGM